jgi:hypothetical protein
LAVLGQLPDFFLFVSCLLVVLILAPLQLLLELVFQIVKLLCGLFLSNH